MMNHIQPPQGQAYAFGETYARNLTDQERAFVVKVTCEGTRLYRDLPWRGISDPYAVLVSEVMLQQTQVARVEKYWRRFLQLFPTLDALASADTSLVLESWQGLGYNRRALALKKTAEQCAYCYEGKLPESLEELLALPGIGKATAAGVRAFAFGKPGVYLETNVRTVFLHEFFPLDVDVPDKVIEPLVERTCSVEDPRGWYYALLDYGAYLKSVLPNPSRRSRHHSQQSRFEGSRRQKRAELVRVVLAQHQVTFLELCDALNGFEAAHDRPAVDPEVVRSITDDLVREGFFVQEGTGESARYYAL